MCIRDRSGWLCVHSRTLWVSPTNSPVRLGVSPTATSTPTGVFNQWFEALFPRAGALGCVVCHLVHQLLPRQSAAALPTPLHNPPPLWVCQLPPCSESSPPGCPSLLLLPTFLLYLLGSWTSMQFDFLSVLVVVFKLLLSFFWLCTVCLPTPPSWPEVRCEDF